MCGIAGQVTPAGRPVDMTLVERMTGALAHRGPDGQGFKLHRQCGLGHRRLSIIDVATGGQPLANEDRTLWLVANGEIYNHVELRAELQAGGHRFATASDAEVILHLYEDRGDDCVQALVGMFAFALWDEPGRRLLLARDRFGIKPLYYVRHGDGTLLFASELKALLRDSRVDRELEPAAIREYFRHLTLPEPHTVFRAVRKVPAGHLLTWCAGEVAERRYWDLTRVARQSPALPEETALARLRDELANSVRLTLRSDVPLGVFLSGGVDSSLLTWLAGTVGDAPVPTFSVAFEESGFDESPFSRLVARTFGTRHEEVLVTMDAATDACLELTRHLDEPFADASCIPTYILARHARASVKTVLTGEGADELFGGNPWHTDEGADTDSLGRVLAAPSKVVFTEPQLDRVCSEDLRAAMAEVPLRPTPETQAAFARCARGLERRLWADLHFYLPSDLLTKADRTTMRASLEARVPYLNHPLVEYAWSLPSNLRLRNGRRKYALKRLGEGHLPPEILERDKKGFSIPLDLWLWRPGRFRDMVWEVLLDDRTRRRGQFAMDAVETMLGDHDRLRAFHGYQLWTLFVFELWQRHFLDQPARVPA